MKIAAYRLIPLAQPTPMVRAMILATLSSSFIEATSFPAALALGETVALPSARYFYIVYI
jgi:hypothetical protein